MITESNFKKVLRLHGFHENGDSCEKYFPNLGTSLRVDFKKKKLYYPDNIKGRERNNGFSECDIISAQYEVLQKRINAWMIEIEKLLMELDESNRSIKIRLADVEKFDVSIGNRVLNKELVADGTVPVYSANVYEPFGYINKLLIKDFSLPSVIWGIDGDWMTRYMPENTEFYPTDHCGVLRCKTSEVNPRYMVHILEIEGRKMGFSRSYRASIDRVQGITFSVPNRSVQDKAISKIEELEKQITEAQQKLEKLSGKIADILNQYLN